MIFDFILSLLFYLLPLHFLPTFHFPLTTFYSPLSTFYLSLCTKSPLLSFGSNHVDFGGITIPASAIESRSSMVVGYIEKAIAMSVSARRSSSLKPLMPPTNPILWSVLGFPIPRTGSRRFFWRIETSKRSTGSESSHVPCFALNLYHEQ